MFFLLSLRDRNEPLFYFGLINLLLAIVFMVFSRTNAFEVQGANAWYKPIKFCLSTTSLSWAMAWYLHYLQMPFQTTLYSWGIMLLLGFEVGYIAWQAARGQQSHFNVSTPVYAILYSLMAIAATLITLWTGFMGIFFFTGSFPDLPDYYLWAIRLGIIIFVVFALEGFVMGAQMRHTIGAADGGQGLPFLGWSTKYGDPRIAHFIGMHALQILPLLSYFILKDTKATLIVSALYVVLAVFTLVQALNAKPLLRV